ncbi:putative transposase [Pacificimonas flava]|uniref:Putative transposase n=2 Tax=Pacificimonas flava TaxID=1234595 RepID=M2TJV7_9SPHN|nr:IS66 family transposase [Pacificimonas flava]EMD81941.1 putative transposase [Pacificimonas flava]
MLLEADLPDDPDALRAIIAGQAEAQRRLTDQVAALEAAGTEADAEIARLNAIIAAFQRHRFGARSEQLDEDQLQLALEEIGAALASVHAGREAAAKDAGTPPPRKTNRGSLPAHLERIEQTLELKERVCSCCGGDLHVIGEDVAERLDVVPASFRVLVTRRPRYGCRSCEAAPVQAPAPARIVDRGIPTEALVAHVLTAKYADHLPLYRQAQIYARQGVTLDRSTLADWTGRAAWWLRPLRDHLLAELKKSGKLFADETTAPVLDPGRGRTKTGQLWAYARDDRSWGDADPPAVAYRYAPDRKAERPIEHLTGFAGTLQVDGYGGYGALARRGDVQLAFCWAHVRRRFYELAAQGTSPVASEVLTRIAALYKVEADVRGACAEDRQKVRQERSTPLVQGLRQLLDARLGQLSRKSRLAEAIRYALIRWDGLVLFLEDGRIELDNNSVERSIRPLALNRKNALFAGSDQGGEHWAVIASLIETCKLNKINPEAWLTRTLTRLAQGHSSQRLGELMPWNYTPTVG